MSERQVVVLRCACGDEEYTDVRRGQTLCYDCGQRFSTRVVTVSSPELPHPSER
jgi:hypothetical protein